MLCVILSAHTGFFVSCSSCFFFFDPPDPMAGRAVNANFVNDPQKKPKMASSRAFLIFLVVAGSDFRSASAFAPAQVALLSAAGLRCSTGVFITQASFRIAHEAALTQRSGCKVENVPGHCSGMLLAALFAQVRVAMMCSATRSCPAANFHAAARSCLLTVLRRRMLGASNYLNFARCCAVMCAQPSTMLITTDGSALSLAFARALSIFLCARICAC